MDFNQQVEWLAAWFDALVPKPEDCWDAIPFGVSAGPHYNIKHEHTTGQDGQYRWWGSNSNLFIVTVDYHEQTIKCESHGDIEYHQFADNVKSWMDRVALKRDDHRFNSHVYCSGFGDGKRPDIWGN